MKFVTSSNNLNLIVSSLSRITLLTRIYNWLRFSFLPDQFGVRQRDLKRLARVPRFTRTYLNILNHKMELTDSKGHLILYKEIFSEQIYKFPSESTSPFIIDCGANIGMSVLYFKWLYPNSEILAFEPDPKIFSVLEKNINTYKLQSVSLQPFAIWNKETTLRFILDGGVGGRFAYKTDINNTILVKTLRFKNLLFRDIDLLKIDIEGAEYDVIEDCKDELHCVKNLFIEYHGVRAEPQRLDKLLFTLSEKGFRYHITDALRINQPFINKFIRENIFDLQLNIFAWRVS